MVSYEVMKIENENGQLQSADNEKYKTHVLVILFIHYSCFFILCLNVLYHSLITIGLITLKHFPC